MCAEKSLETEVGVREAYERGLMRDRNTMIRMLKEMNNDPLGTISIGGQEDGYRYRQAELLVKEGKAVWRFGKRKLRITSEGRNALEGH